MGKKSITLHVCNLALPAKCDFMSVVNERCKLCKNIQKRCSYKEIVATEKCSDKYIEVVKKLKTYEVKIKNKDIECQNLGEKINRLTKQTDYVGLKYKQLNESLSLFIRDSINCNLRDKKDIENILYGKASNEETFQKISDYFNSNCKKFMEFKEYLTHKIETINKELRNA